MTAKPGDTPVQEPEGESAARVRRPVLDSGGSEPQQRPWGCLTVAGILGILVGVAFAFYGLPPILRHFYGEQHVAPGQTYTGAGKVIRLVTVVPPSTATPAAAGDSTTNFVAEFEVTTSKTWDARASDFSLEFAGGGKWIQATGIRLDSHGLPAAAVTFNGAALASSQRLEVIFPVHAGTPAFVHLATPRVRFAVPETSSP